MRWLLTVELADLTDAASAKLPRRTVVVASPATATARAMAPAAGRSDRGSLELLWTSFPCPHFGNFAGPDQPHGAAAAGAGHQVVGLALRLLLRVGGGPKRQRQPVRHLLSDRDDLGLLRRQLERRGLPDLDLAALLVFLDRLVDRQYANIFQDRFGNETFRPGASSASDAS